MRGSSTPGFGSALLPIGSAPDGASAEGVLDMVGSASEWVMANGTPTPDHPLRGSSWLDRYGRDDWLSEQSLAGYSAGRR